MFERNEEEDLNIWEWIAAIALLALGCPGLLFLVYVLLDWIF